LAERLSNLRAGVLGANDGILSTAGLVVGVAGATGSSSALLVAGVAGLVGGALSMAAGEYVSVSSARASQRALLDAAEEELREDPLAELELVVAHHKARGLSEATARQVASELMAHDAVRATLAARHDGDVDDEASPWGAAVTSMLAFALGALLPLLAIALPPEGSRLLVTVLVVLAALALTGVVSARLGKAPAGVMVVRNVLGGAVAMGVTYAAGSLVGTLL
jgi:VIT1/CCC1 family predicted Fe2+/Mn2+ transporter